MEIEIPTIPFMEFYLSFVGFVSGFCLDVVRLGARSAFSGSLLRIERLFRYCVSGIA